jgi:hypothetical protein
MIVSFIEPNPPDVQGKVCRLGDAIHQLASLFPTGAQIGDDTLLFGDRPEGLL